ncbi:hypothetical protein TrCOL_g13784 [Triparma columacea]|uniref:Uncharacterized protein n=1 Tax=Triparma columacea TaxID=722753 RepID=A0A9W7GKQ5_9STRA|nr:hypothetical protein TrCOL_g13784 [Triparma columacea]
MLCCCFIPSSSSARELDDVWRTYLTSPPPHAISLASDLKARADSLASEIQSSSLAVDLSDIDVVVSGGGNYDAFYLGVQMMMSRLEGPRINVARYAGVSAGGMMPFEVALKGEDATLLSHLSYGVLTEEYSEHYKSTLQAGYLEDHHWRIMAAWQTETYADRLAGLDGRVIMGTSCFKPLPTLVLIDSYTAVDDQATHAFMSTGTYLEMYGGYPCTDGGLTTGDKMTPLFQDNVRPQMVVDLMATGANSELVFKVLLDDYVDLIKTGMDEFVNFVTKGQTEREGIISLCPVGSDVKDFVCKV